MTALRPDYAHLPLHRLGESVAVSGPVVVFCNDDRYTFQMRVALASIFLNSPSRSLDIVVFAIDWQDSSIDALDRLARRFARPVTVIRVSESLIPVSFASPRFPRATFFRLLVPEILVGDRLLYLDADIVVQIDLDEIWREGRDDMMVGGVPNNSARDWKRSLGIPEPDLYVNSGVLLINMAAWRAGRALERCGEWLGASQRQVVLADQDVINGALAGSIYPLPACWNVTPIGQPRTWRLHPDSFRGIFHFAGPAKPWMRWSTPVVQEFYLHYARLVGLPAGYWIEARNAGEAMVEAHFAEMRGNHAKASAIRRRVAETALAKLREIDPGIAVEVG